MDRAARSGRRTLLRGVRVALCGGVLAFGGAGCESEPPALEVGDVGFSRGELGALGPEQQEGLADLTAFGLTVAEGRVDSLIRPYVEADLRSIVLQRLAIELAAERAGLGEPELRLAYDARPRHELVVRHLVVLSERWRPPEHRDSARAVAAEALQRARDGTPFPELAAEFSDEPGAAERGGLLDPGREGSWVPEFWRAASALEEGAVSDVVETEFGFHVIKLEERRRVPFEEVRDDVLREVTDLSAALGRANDWADRQVPEGTVDTPAARRHIMLQRAEALGIEPSASQRAAIERRWEGRVDRWAEALGFREGLSTTQVKERALQALGSTAQSAAIARSELDEMSDRLRDLYPVNLTAVPRR